MCVCMAALMSVGMLACVCIRMWMPEDVWGHPEKSHAIFFLETGFLLWPGTLVA